MPAKKKQGKKNENRNVVVRTLENPRVWKFLVRLSLGALFFISAFNISTTAFFNDNPIFGVRFLAEILIGLAFAVFGFHTVPIIGMSIKNWFEEFIAETVTEIVSEFWEEQSSRMAAARREKEKRKKKDDESKNKERFAGAIILDTSIFIDGRLLDIVKTGFIFSDIVISQSVLDELHLLSDSGNDLKRARGRRGLDMVNDLKKIVKGIKGRNTYVFKSNGDVSKKDGVDKELVRLAKKYKMKLMTLDYNLNKVAKAGGVEALNINELANALKTNVLPGEKLKVKIVQKGKEKGQGVGYLDDGTMIVVVGAEDKQGKNITATVSRIIQTDAGKMVFCEL
jgi:uncharacterized protein YacL